MGQLWERLAGDTSRFAMKLALADDPDVGTGASADESASWGALQIWVEGQNLCAHTTPGEPLSAVHWYLLPVLEWFADNWDPLLHEEKLPVRVAAESAADSLDATKFPPIALTDRAAHQWESVWHDWWARHNLRACRSGGFLPNLCIRRWRDTIELSWADRPVSGIPDDFRFSASQGISRLPPLEVAGAIYAVCVDAVSELQRRHARSPRLKRLAAAFSKVKTGQTDTRLAWMAGMAATKRKMVQNWQDLVIDLEDKAGEAVQAVFTPDANELVLTGSCHASLMFGSVSPTIGRADILLLTQQLLQSFDGKGDSAKLRTLRSKIAVENTRGSRPWEQGYRLAERVLEICGEPRPVAGAIDLDALVTQLRIRRDEIHLQDAGIRAISIAGDKHRPTILVNVAHDANDSPAGLRFSLAHELGHILVDRAAGQRLALASGPWAPRDVEKRANAFAAMLLMPTELVEAAVTRVSEDKGTLSWVKAVARYLGTSASATLEHLYNLGLIDEATRDQLRAAPLDATSARAVPPTA